MNELVFRNANGVPMTNSLLIAETFGKAHRGVLRDIDNLECSEDFQMHNFVQMFKIRELPNGGQAQDRYYNITRDGFTFLAMGYTGKKAAEFKEKYIAAFNAMEQQIRQGLQLSSEFMQAQMQMMQQMMALCTSMQQRMDRMEQSMASPVGSTPSANTEQPQTDRTPTTPNKELNGELWNKCIMTYVELHLYYPDYKNTHDVAKELRRRGIQIYQRGLFKYLRTRGYLSDGEYTFNRPSEECAMNHHMVAVPSGRSGRTGGKRAFVPYHSPAFVDILEDELRSVRRTIKQPYLPLDGYGKEVRP